MNLEKIIKNTLGIVGIPICIVGGVYFGDIVGELIDNMISCDYQIFQTVGLVTGLVNGLYFGNRLNVYVNEK